MLRVNALGVRTWGEWDQNDWILAESAYVGTETGPDEGWAESVATATGERIEELAIDVAEAVKPFLPGWRTVGVVAALAALGIGGYALMRRL
jgi:hypothetical protein